MKSWIGPESNDAGLLRAMTRLTPMSMVESTDRRSATVLSSDASWFSTTRLMQCLALDAHTDVVGVDDDETMHGTSLDLPMATVAMLMACQDLEANLCEKRHPPTVAHLTVARRTCAASNCLPRCSATWPTRTFSEPSPMGLKSRARGRGDALLVQLLHGGRTEAAGHQTRRQGGERRLCGHVACM